MSMFTRYSLVLGIFFQLFFSLKSTGQKNFNQQLQIPKPPEVSSFEKFIESPVSLHTGLHDVTIPIYNLQLKGIAIPIALKYHSGGVKVDDFASEVGLGWSLDAGGVVSSTVHGLPDEQGDWPNSYYPKIEEVTLDYQFESFSVSDLVYQTNSEDPFSLYDIYSNTDIAFVRGAIRGLRDSEPDIFFFSMPGKSGKFFADGTNVFRTIPFQKVIIERLLSGYVHMGYRITDEGGTIFEFTKKGTSITASESPCSNPWPSGIYQPTYPHSSFHLTKITTIAGDTVDFYYSPYSYISKNQNQYSRAALDSGDDFDCRDFIQSEDPCLGLTLSTTTFNTFTLDSIKTSKGHKVVFNYGIGERLDKGTRSLESIHVFVLERGDFKKVKEYQLHQSYFVSVGGSAEDPTLGYRMRLDSAGEVGKPPYVFEYDHTNLPLRLSFGQDHWGFYNGQGNPHLLPREDHNGFESGANREPDFNFAKAGILQSIQYPTGGTLEFEYEPNSYYSDGGELYYTTDGIGVNSQPDNIVDTTFTILSNQVKKKFFWSNSYDGVTIHNDYCVIEITGPNNFIRLLYGYGPSNGELVSLAPGTYHVRIETYGSTYSGNFAVTWLNELSRGPGNRITGGLRIKSSRNCTEPGGSCVKRRYEYVEEDTTRSSGITFQIPLYTHARDRVFWKIEDGYCHPTPVNCSPILQSSNSLTPLYSSQGTHVVYDYVTVFQEGNEETGKSTYSFLVDKSQNPSYSAPPFPYVVTYDWLNGLPLETTHFAYKNEQYIPVQKTSNVYSYEEIGNGLSEFPNQFSVRGVRINLYDYPTGLRVQCGTLVSYFLPPVVFEFVPFRLISSWHYPTQSKEQFYNESGQETLSQTTFYHYDNSEHIQITREIQVDSHGDTTTVKKTYPLDYPGSLNSAIVKMRTDNIITPVLEQKLEKTKEGLSYLTNADLTLYDVKNNTVLPDKIMKLELVQPLLTSAFTSFDGTTLDSRYSVDTEFEFFDAYNNVIQYKDKTGINKTLLWDYSNTSLVAEVSNATKEQVAYTSFETDNDGYWNVSGSSRVEDDSLTGSRCYSLVSGSISRTGLPSTGLYTVSYWAKSGASVEIVTQQIVESKSLQTSGDWTLYVHTLQVNSTVVIQGSGYIDELRLYPASAVMSTLTYKPGVGPASITDQTGLPKFYQYDSNGRPIAILDYQRNVLANHVYHYKRNP